MMIEPIKVADEPTILIYDYFLDPDECQYFIEQAKETMTRATVTGGDGDIVSKARTNSKGNLLPDDDAVMDAMERIADLAGIPVHHCEPPQVVHYKEGEEYLPHFDAWVPGEDAASDKFLMAGGNRLATGLLYLNTVHDGGSTLFPLLDVEILPRVGRLVLFQNMHEGERHPLSQHGGMAAGIQEKWACNFWFREHPYGVPTPEYEPNEMRRVF